MASVEELIALANHENRARHPGVGAVESLLSGVQQSQQNGLDRTMKLIQLDQLRQQQQQQAEMQAQVKAQMDNQNESAITQGFRSVDPKSPTMPAQKLAWEISQDENGSYSRKLKITDPSKSGDTYTPDQAGAIASGDVNRVTKAFPGGVPKDVLTASMSAGKQSISLGEKQDQFLQKEWDKIDKETNPLTAPSRTPLGMASRANLNADRALTTLSKPVVTYQEAGNVMADIAGIYQGGSPTNAGLSHQEYSTLYGNIQKARQSLTGNPTDALPDALKQRLIQDLQDMKGTNAKVIKQNLDVKEKSQKKVISHFSQEWADRRKLLEGDQTNGATDSAKKDPGARFDELIAAGKSEADAYKIMAGEGF